MGWLVLLFFLFILSVVGFGIYYDAPDEYYDSTSYWN